MSKGRFGIHGGQYVPETLMTAVNELETYMTSLLSGLTRIFATLRIKTFLATNILSLF